MSGVSKMPLIHIFALMSEIWQQRWSLNSHLNFTEVQDLIRNWTGRYLHLQSGSAVWLYQDVQEFSLTLESCTGQGLALGKSVSLFDCPPREELSCLFVSLSPVWTSLLSMCAVPGLWGHSQLQCPWLLSPGTSATLLSSPHLTSPHLVSPLWALRWPCLVPVPVSFCSWLLSGPLRLSLPLLGLQSAVPQPFSQGWCSQPRASLAATLTAAPVCLENLIQQNIFCNWPKSTAWTEFC